MTIEKFLVASVFLLSSSALRGAESEPPTLDEIRNEFETLCRQFNEGGNYYWGQAIENELRGQLESADVAPDVELHLRGRLGMELVRLGRSEEAISLLQDLRAVVEQVPEQQDFLARLLYGLGVAHLQLAEDQNCVLNHGAASCLLPIREAGFHARPQHSRAAAESFQEYLRIRPDDPQAAWLLNLSRMVSRDYPQRVPQRWRLPPRVFESEPGFKAWIDRAPDLGVDVADLGGGAVMDDLDGDGLLDLVSSTTDPCGSLRAFRNDGEGGFEDTTEAWGLAGQLGGINLVQADYNNDGFLDLLVLRGGWLGEEGRIRNSLLLNQLEGPARRFVDVTAQAGMTQPAYPTQSGAWADFDGDGDLDLFVGSEHAGPPDWPSQLYRSPGTSTPTYLFHQPPAISDLMKYLQPDHVYPSQLFRNNGDGTFTDVAAAARVANRRWVKGATWGDYDNDGDPDLYVSNLGPNRLYRNNGDGTFDDVAQQLGVEQPSLFSFTTWFFDYDNDADLDLYVSNYVTPIPGVAAWYLRGEAPSPGVMIYRNDGGKFQDATRELGLKQPVLAMGANYGDLDNDGWLDLYLGTGGPDLDTLMPNVMFRNRDGRSFHDVTFAGGFGHLQKGHGVAFGDLDNDGDQDLFEQMGGVFPGDTYANVLFENPGTQANWLTLRLRGRQSNRFGVGARVEVKVLAGETRRSIHLLVGSGGSFGSSSLQQEVGLGAADAIDSVVVRWPGSGVVQVFRDVVPNRFYEVVEGESSLRPLHPPRPNLGASQPSSRHRHHGEEPPGSGSAPLPPW